MKKYTIAGLSGLVVAAIVYALLGALPPTYKVEGAFVNKSLGSKAGFLSSQVNQRLLYEELTGQLHCSTALANQTLNNPVWQKQMLETSGLLALYSDYPADQPLKQLDYIRSQKVLEAIYDPEFGSLTVRAYSKKPDHALQVVQNAVKIFNTQQFQRAQDILQNYPEDINGITAVFKEDEFCLRQVHELMPSNQGTMLNNVLKILAALLAGFITAILVFNFSNKNKLNDKLKHSNTQ